MPSVAVPFFKFLVLKVQFTSATYSGLESSGEVLATIVILGGMPNVSISVNVRFSEATATGKLSPSHI